MDHAGPQFDVPPPATPPAAAEFVPPPLFGMVHGELLNIACAFKSWIELPEGKTMGSFAVPSKLPQTTLSRNGNGRVSSRKNGFWFMM